MGICTSSASNKSLTFPSSNKVSSPSPSPIPSSLPSTMPTSLPSTIPTSLPSTIPSSLPSTIPSSLPSLIPSSLPSPTSNSIPYSCIPRIEIQNYYDLSYEKLSNVINLTIKKIKKKNLNNGFSYTNCNKEFEILQTNIDKDAIHLNALEEGFSELNRYSNIKSYKHNRLDVNTKQKYINASPINVNGIFYFISTQGPKANTIEDFWTMIEQYKCNTIIMLCNLIELGKEKCSKYWENINTGKYLIELISDEGKYNNIIERKIKFKSQTNSTETTITQIHYLGWPDHGVPDINNGFGDFLYMIRRADELKGNNPIVIHCSAGVGRTGTFLSIYFLYKEIMEQINNPQLTEIQFSVFNMVRKLKEMRLLMVQNKEQYKFIYVFIDYLLIQYNK